MEDYAFIIATLQAENTALKATVAQMQAMIEELQARLAQNSANSSKPPSSDGLQKKTIKPALTKQVGKKPGGQPGHPGKTLRFVEQPDLIHTHQATQCQQCGLPLQGPGQVVARRQVFDLPQPRLFVEEHQVLAHQCACGCLQTGHFPDSVWAPVQYGPRIQAQSILLNIDYKLPCAKIRQFWADLTGYGVSRVWRKNPSPLFGIRLRVKCEKDGPNKAKDGICLTDWWLMSRRCWPLLLKQVFPSPIMKRSAPCVPPRSNKRYRGAFVQKRVRSGMPVLEALLPPCASKSTTSLSS